MATAVTGRHSDTSSSLLHRLLRGRLVVPRCPALLLLLLLLLLLGAMGSPTVWPTTPAHQRRRRGGNGPGTAQAQDRVVGRP